MPFSTTANCVWKVATVAKISIPSGAALPPIYTFPKNVFGKGGAFEASVDAILVGVGLKVGIGVGVGVGVGKGIGVAVGVGVGAAVGAAVGACVGAAVGAGSGAAVATGSGALVVGVGVAT